MPKPRIIVVQFGGMLVNKTDGGEGVCGAVRTAEWTGKIASALRGKKASVEAREKMSLARRGREKKPEHVAKVSLANTGQRRSAEARKKMSDAATGRKVSEDTRRRMSESQKGRKHSEASIIRMREAQQKRDYWPSPDDEARLKMSEAQRRRAPVNRKFKGVSLFRGNGKHRARIGIGGKSKTIGYFHTQEEAARAYDKAAFDAWGRDCYLNFPMEFTDGPKSKDAGS